jgi:hypothetical protein
MNNTAFAKAQETIGVILAANGESRASEEAFTATTRQQLDRLADLAIRTTPEYTRTLSARNIKLVLDNPEIGGAGLAADFEIRAEKNPVTGATWYKGYKLLPGKPGKEEEYVGFASPDPDTLERRLVGMFVVREITQILGGE